MRSHLVTLTCGLAVATGCGGASKQTKAPVPAADEGVRFGAYVTSLPATHVLSSSEHNGAVLVFRGEGSNILLVDAGKGQLDPKATDDECLQLLVAYTTAFVSDAAKKPTELEVSRYAAIRTHPTSRHGCQIEATPKGGQPAIRTITSFLEFKSGLAIVACVLPTEVTPDDASCQQVVALVREAAH
jgi:hypothetical protein